MKTRRGSPATATERRPKLKVSELHGFIAKLPLITTTDHKYIVHVRISGRMVA